MSEPKDEPKGLDRRDVMRGALVLGGATLLGGVAATPQNAVISEREWARVLARHMANQLPQAVSQVNGIQLNADQVAVLQRAFENTLVTNMGCDVPVDQPPPGD